MDRILVTLSCLCLCLSFFVIPSMAAEVETASAGPERVVLDYQDFISDSEYTDDTKILTVSLPADYCSVGCKTADGVTYVLNDVSGNVDFAYGEDCYASFKFCMPGLLYSEPRYYFSVDELNNGMPFHLFANYFVKPNFEGTYRIKLFYQINYYNSSYSNIAVYPTNPKQLIIDNCSGLYEGSFATSETDDAITIPDGAKYFGVSLVLRVEDIVLADAGSADTISIDFGFSDWGMQLTKERTFADSLADVNDGVGNFMLLSAGWLSSLCLLVVAHPVLILCFAIPLILFVVAVIKRLD